MPALPPTLYLFAGCNGAGKTTFARAYLTQLDPIPRFLNADEIACGLSPLNPRKIAVKAGKLLLHEIDGCLTASETFGLESTLSGTSYTRLLQRAKSLGYQVEIHYLWLPSPSLAIRRIAQRVKKGGHAIPDADVKRRFPGVSPISRISTLRSPTRGRFETTVSSLPPCFSTLQTPAFRRLANFYSHETD